MVVFAHALSSGVWAKASAAHIYIFLKLETPRLESFNHLEILVGPSLTYRLPREGLGGRLEDHGVLVGIFG